MSRTTLYRLSGVALLASGVLSVISYGVGAFQNDESPAMVASAPYVAMAVLAFVGAALAIVGLPAVIARQNERAGILGLIGGVALMLVQMIYGIGNGFVNATIIPALVTGPAASAIDITTPPPLMGVFFNIGIALTLIGGLALAIATLRARVFARWIGVALLLATIGELGGAFPLPFVSNLAPILFSVAFFGAGIALVAMRDASAAEPVRATVAAAV